MHKTYEGILNVLSFCFEKSEHYFRMFYCGTIVFLFIDFLIGRGECHKCTLGSICSKLYVFMNT